jgi:Tfp pilus assembly PilM family ATPase
MASLPVPLLHRLVPLAARRVAVIDPGRHALKVLVAESSLGRFRVLHRQMVLLPEDGLLPPEELRQHLRLVLPELGPHEVALVLPQHRTITQTLELPADQAASPSSFLTEQARNLSGLNAEAMAISYTPLRPYAAAARPYVLTFCKQEEVTSLIARFGPTADETQPTETPPPLVAITTTAQALCAAYRALAPDDKTAVLVDLGAQETVVAILLEGQGVFATSFEGGSHSFTVALAEASRATLSAAESLKQAQNLFAGSDTVEAVGHAVETWLGQLRRTITEWQEDLPELRLPSGPLTVWLCGGGSGQPGLIEFLNRQGHFRFQRWPLTPDVPNREPMDRYWVAYGAALVALGREPRPLSLLSPELVKQQRVQRVWEAMQAALVVLLAMVLMLLTVGTWQQVRSLGRAKALVTSTTAALQSARTIAELGQRLEAGFASIDPLVHRQRQTLELLQTWTAIAQVRTNNDFWFVLFGDAASYQDGTTLPRPATNDETVFTVPAPPRSEFIAEICIPQEGDAARRVLNQLVGSLKRQNLFANVDALPAERKRDWVDSRVFISNHVYGLAIELAAAEWPRTNHTLTNVAAPAPRDARRRTKTATPLPSNAATLKTVPRPEPKPPAVGPPAAAQPAAPTNSGTNR